MSETESSDNSAPAAKPRRLRRWGIGACLVSLVLVLAVCAAVAGALFYSQGRTLQAPEWMREMAVEQFSEALPDAVVTFDNLTLEVENDWHPRILLERVVVTPKDGSRAIEFSEAETSLSYRRLLQRQIAPRDIRLSGVFLNARREAEGQVGVSVGSAQTAGGTSTALSDVVVDIDKWLSLPEFERLTSVDVNAVTIQFDDLRAQRSWTVDGGQMQMVRDGDELRISSNLALLGGRDYVSTVELNYESQIGEVAASFGVTIDDVVSTDIATQSPALAWLEILDAPISGAMRVEIDDEGDLGPLSATLQIDEGVIQPQEDFDGIPFQSARSYLTYVPETNTIQFDELFVESPWVTAGAEGKAHLDDFQNGLPNSLIAQIRLTQMEGNPANLFDASISIDGGQADMKLQLDPFELTIGEMLIQDRGQSLVLDAQLSATEDDWVVAVNGRMDALDSQRVTDWWPENAAAKTRKWVDENILEGRLTDINFAARSKPGSRPDIYVDFAFEDAAVRYAKRLPIVTGGKGQAVLYQDRFTVMTDEGVVSPGEGGLIDVSGTSFVIPNIRIKQPPSVTYLETDATVTATLALLDHEPMSFLTKADKPVDLAEGFAKVKGELRLPLRPKLQPTDVEFDLTADLIDVRTDYFVKDKVLASPMLVAKATNETLTIEGPGRIGDVPFNATFQTGLAPDNGGRSSVTGTLELSERFIDEFNIGLTRDLVSGSGKGEIALDFVKGEPGRFSVTSDTLGLNMGIAALGWSKPADRSAELVVEGALTQPLSVTNLQLSATGLSARGAISLKSEGGVDRLSLSQVTVGNWLDGSANLIGRAGRPPEVELLSGTLDMRNAPEGGSGNANGPGTNIYGSMDSVTISDGITLTGLQGNFSTAGGFNGEFTSRVNGEAAITGTIVPNNGRSAVRIRSADAGGTLRSAGVFKQAVGGNLDVTLQPVGGQGQYRGNLSASSVRVKDAPAMAELLNAISVVGLLDQMGGEGIFFSDVNAEFNLHPSYVQVTQGSAAGPSMGISMDGIYNLNAKSLDMQGVISPIYVLNAIGRPISKRGEGLFGFNYSLRGSSDDPSVSVNPLSVLTPGFLRDIFRRSIETPETNADTETQ